VITIVSLGTIGTSASRQAAAKTIRYAHPDAPETSWVKWLNISELRILAVVAVRSRDAARQVD
jgi:hypothetical protein